MTEQEKSQGKARTEPAPAEETRNEQPPEHHDRFRETTDKIWESTRHAWGTATFKAGQYKKLVQKKIDLAALHKKINAAHADLGKTIDDLHDVGNESIMEQAVVGAILTRLDELKAAAAALEEEVEQIRNEEPPQEEPPSESSQQ